MPASASGFEESNFDVGLKLGLKPQPLGRRLRELRAQCAQRIAHRTAAIRAFQTGNRMLFTELLQLAGGFLHARRPAAPLRGPVLRSPGG